MLRRIEATNFEREAEWRPFDPWGERDGLSNKVMLFYLLFLVAFICPKRLNFI